MVQITLIPVNQKKNELLGEGIIERPSLSWTSSKLPFVIGRNSLTKIADYHVPRKLAELTFEDGKLMFNMMTHVHQVCVRGERLSQLGKKCELYNKDRVSLYKDCYQYTVHILGTSSTHKKRSSSPLPAILSSNKRPKSIITASETPFLPPEIFSIVLPFLAPREMYRLVFTCKSFMGMLRHKHVVRSAVMQGGHSRLSMHELMIPLKDKSIFFPSPMRLLRIVNGRRCENAGCSAGVNKLRPKYGIFFCQKCHSKKRGATCVVDTQHFREKSHSLIEALTHPRVVATSFGHEFYLWREPFTAAGGERSGPLVSRKEIVNDILKEEISVDNYIKSLPLDSTKDYDTLIDTYSKALRDAELTDEEKITRQRKRRMDTVAARVLKVKEVAGRVAAHFNDAPWKEFAMACTWADTSSYYPGPLCAQFQCGFVHQIMEVVIRAPSKASKRVTKRLATKIQFAFEVIYKKGVHDLSFLSNKMSSEPFEAHLRQFLSQQYTPKEFLLDVGVDKDFLNYIHMDRLLEAVSYRISGMHKNLKTPNLSCFSVAVVPQVGDVSNHQQNMDFAQMIWNESVAKSNSEEKTGSCSFMSTCKTIHAESSGCYQQLRIVALKYVTHDETIEFINKSTGYEAGSPEDRLMKSFREIEVQSVWGDKSGYKYLEAQDFEKMREYHDRKVLNAWERRQFV